MKISFVIPCYKSEGSVALVIDEIRNVIKEREGCQYEVIAVNDCSPDNVLEVLKKEAEKDKNVKVIDLAKNGGRHNALICGCNYAKGDIIVFVDDDQQCPVDRLWDLISPLENGYDVSIAKYKKKKQAWWKNIGSKLNGLIANWILEKDKDISFSNFSAMKAFIKDEVIKYKNPYPYMSGLMVRSTKRITNVEMEERERTIGTGNYTFLKSFSLWLNNFTAFSVKPLRIAMMCGAVTSVGGFLFMIYIILRKLMSPHVEVGYSSMMAVILFIGGMIMIMLGLIGEYIGRIYISLNSAPQFVIRETVNIEDRTD